MKSVSIIGMGRVGTALAFSLPSPEFAIDKLVVRDRPTFPLPEGLKERCVTAGSLRELNSDIVFITTPDSQIEAAVSTIQPIFGGSFVFHTSGSQPSSVLAALQDAGAAIGSIHPLVSISDPELGAERFRGSFFCMEGDAGAVAIGEVIVRSLGGKPFSIDTKFKTLYHAAAVTACGHLVALFDAALEMMCETGLSMEKSKEILLPLVSSTVENLGLQTTAAALTGTFARADAETFTRHIRALNQFGSEELLEIYLLLGERSLELASKQGVSPDRIEKLRAKVAIAKSKLKW